MSPGLGLKYDALPSNVRHDEPGGYELQSSGMMQKPRHEYRPTSRLLSYQQEIDTRDGFLSHSGHSGAKFRRTSIISLDTRSPYSALSALEDDAPLKEYSTDGSAKPLQGSATSWRTITLLFGNYIIGMEQVNPENLHTDNLSALLVAILHFVMMYYLNGKPTDDRAYLTQRHVTWLSLLLVAVFRASLCASLAIAFTQRMWRVLRRKALPVSSIESLHGIRFNPLLLGYWRVLSATPLLYGMAVVIWLLTVAVLFPPSALTITLRSFENKESLLVPTFDAEYGREVNIDDTGTSSLSTWNSIPLSHFGKSTDTSTANTMFYS